MRLFPLILAAALAGCALSPDDLASDAGAPADLADHPPSQQRAHSLSAFRFGTTSVVADFNGDGLDDVAIGAPSETVGGVEQAGAVYIYTMRTTGLAYLQTVTANTGGFPIASSGRFGSSLAARDMNGDGKAELVVGCPSCIVSGHVAGAAFVYRGGSTLTATSQTISQAMIPGEAPEDGDRFGEDVAIGLFSAGHPSIAIGVPSELTGSPALRTGWVDVFAISPTLLATPSQGMNDAAFGPLAQNDFGFKLVVMDLDDDGTDELVVGSPGTGAFLDVFKGAPLAAYQKIAGGGGYGMGLGVGYWHNAHFPSGHRMPELAALIQHDNFGFIAMLRPVLAGTAYTLVKSGEIPDPGANGFAYGDGFGYGHYAAADFDHNGSDELIVGANDSGDGLDGHVYVFRSLNGGGMTFWNQRAMKNVPACAYGPTTGCAFGSSVAAGVFHYPATANGGDLDMIVGAPIADRADLYLGDGTHMIPDFDHSIANP